MLRNALSDLAADTAPNHDSQPMPFDQVDVARVARQIDKRPTLLGRVVFGLNSRGVAHLLRKLWLAGEDRSKQLADLISEHHQLCYEFDVYKQDAALITFVLDRTIDRWGEKKPGVIIMSEGEFTSLDHVYDCPDKNRASTRERWAFTYRGFPIWVSRGTTGPFIMTPETFETFKAANLASLVLQEK